MAPAAAIQEYLPLLSSLFPLRAVNHLPGISRSLSGEGVTIAGISGWHARRLWTLRVPGLNLARITALLRMSMGERKPDKGRGRDNKRISVSDPDALRAVPAARLSTAFFNAWGGAAPRPRATGTQILE